MLTLRTFSQNAYPADWSQSNHGYDPIQLIRNPVTRVSGVVHCRADNAGKYWGMPDDKPAFRSPMLGYRATKGSMLESNNALLDRFDIICGEVINPV